MANIPLIYNVSLVDIYKFTSMGLFANNFDSYGNNQLVYSDSQSTSGSVNYTKIPLMSFVYNEEKILDSNSVEFMELQTLNKPETQDINQVLTEYNNILAENRILNQTVNDLITKYEENDDKQVINAQKNTIIKLRIELGQGNVPSDFGDDFPFLPLI